jgi:hypothetical protein
MIGPTTKWKLNEYAFRTFLMHGHSLMSAQCPICPSKADLETSSRHVADVPILLQKSAKRELVAP